MPLQDVKLIGHEYLMVSSHKYLPYCFYALRDGEIKKEAKIIKEHGDLLYFLI